jgi:hypothetical protein
LAASVVAVEFSDLTWQLRHGSVYFHSRIVYSMKSKWSLTFQTVFITFHLAIRAEARPVSVSFLDSEEALQQTTNFLASQGIDANSIDWFRRVVKWHNKTSLGFDLAGFPKSNNGFYTFQSMSNLTDSLTQPLIYASHQVDLDLFILKKLGPTGHTFAWISKTKKICCFG